ncbi:MAG: 4'-phosphopantetheinyl transferase superfamily protein [Cyclobacteriaceae bacterium]|nr:4'-phosphopantetheinyl transferase superfamily protein [Cyclobacteriaceae bacterium HetDA_MAG_MS6]
MIGIDIVDLADPLLKKRKTSDLRFITTGSDFESTTISPSFRFWIYWAIKEATYKASAAKDRFDPRKICINTFHSISKDVWSVSCKFDNCMFSGQAKLTAEYISAVMYVGEKSLPAIHQFFPLKSGQSGKEVRARLKAYAKKELQLTEVIIADPVAGQRPVMRASNNQVIQVSITHHHHWGGFAIIPAANPEIL